VARWQAPLGADPAELLAVDVDELAGTLALVAVGRLERVERGELAEPDPGHNALPACDPIGESSRR
jgi:hypothetical protein